MDEMLDECAVGRLLRATGAEPFALQDVLRALSDLALAEPAIQEVDANPVFVDADGSVRAADALVVVSRKQ